jgi:ParB-like chromosome segregation protein Spo0J
MAKKPPPPMKVNEFQIFPGLSPSEFNALKLDIREHGIMVAIEVDQDGRIVDGHHRVRAWNELRAEGFKVPEYERKIRHYQSDDERLEHALRFNQLRRHLTASQRRDVATELRRRGWSTRQIGRVLDIGKSTVARDLSTVPNGTVETVLGDDVKWRAARRPPTAAAFSAKEEERVRAAYNELGDDLPQRPTRVTSLEKRVRAKRLVPSAPPDGARYLSPDENDDGPDWEVECNDFLDWDLDDESVDLIVTDPPYNEDGIELFGGLSTFAERVLMPGGLCIVYIGKYHLLDELNYHCDPLQYVWMGAIIQTSKPSRIYALKMEGQFRPFVITSKGQYEAERWMHDVIVSDTAPEKKLHPWEQALDPVIEIIQMAASGPSIVCDPFLGSGTTGVAALSLGHSFLGCDIDPRTAREAQDRLAQFSASTELEG